MSDIQKFAGPWALVTGASSGIGRAFAVELAKAGFRLVLSARREHELEELAATLRADHGTDSRVVVMDLAEADAPARLDLATQGLDIGLLVASAGFGSSGPFLASSAATEAEMVDVNCRASMLLCHHFGRRLARRGSGAMVLMSSIVAFQGAPYASNYAATKAYVQALAEGLALELAKTGVRVIAAAPGPVHSGFASRAHMTMGSAESPEVVARATLRRLRQSGTVRPGLLTKVLSGSLATLPRWGRVRVMARIMGGMASSTRFDPNADEARGPVA